MTPHEAARLCGLKGKSLKRFTEFYTRVTAWIESIGGTRNPEGSWHDFTIPTKAGLYQCSCRCHLRGDGYGHLMGRFESIDLAKGFVDCSPFSGKWNHHFFEDWTMDTIMSELDRLFRNITITEQKQ